MNLIMKQKGFAPILILLIITIVGAVGFVGYKSGILDIQIPKKESIGLTPTPSTSLVEDPLAGWKTYSSSEKFFSAKYPPTWSVKETDKAIGFKSGSLGITVNYNLEAFGIECDEVTKEKKITVSGIATTKTTFKAVSNELCGENPASTMLWTTVQKVSNRYDITTSFAPADPDGLEAIYDLFLTSIDLTEDKSATPLVSTPTAGAKVTCPLTVSGKVPPGWMFEGVFPIKLVGASREIIVQGQGKEKVAGSWTSGTAVDFTASLIFTTSAKSGYLILENDNPSGDPAKAKSFEVPVTF